MLQSKNGNLALVLLIPVKLSGAISQSRCSLFGRNVSLGLSH